MSEPLKVVPIGPADHVETRREFPRRERQAIPEELDANGDVIFRFKLDPHADADGLTLREFYRQSIVDLLRVVRFFSGGNPVIVEGFAFLNAPRDQIPLLALTSAADESKSGDRLD